MCEGLVGVADGEIVMPMTCMLDGHEHAVTDSWFCLSVTGRYQAICSHVVVPGSMGAPPGAPCGDCLALLRPVPVPSTVHRLWRILSTRRAHSGVTS